MNVIFISECNGKAARRTKAILDNIATRIGPRTWETAITEKGLESVYQTLNKCASKNTCVLCKRVVTRKRMEVQWIVGKKTVFSSDGKFPISITKKPFKFKDTLTEYYELVECIAIMAAIFHDFGKSSELFQNMLKGKGKIKSGIRHEYISGIICNYIFQQTGWENNIDDIIIPNELDIKIPPLENLEGLEFLINTLVISHHIKPDLMGDFKKQKFDFDDIRKYINYRSGYFNMEKEEEEDTKIKALIFKEGLPNSKSTWVKKFKELAQKINFSKCRELANKSLNDQSWKLVYEMSRQALVTGDHEFSSIDLTATKPKERCKSKYKKTYANTNRSKKLNQYLDEHLIGVTETTIEKLRSLKKVYSLETSIHPLNIPSNSKVPARFEWQDKVTEFLKTKNIRNTGGLLFSMNSTGTGKTWGALKVLNSISDVGRMNFCTPLRGLTLQSFEALKKEIGSVTKDDIGALIGDSYLSDLYGEKQSTPDNDEDENGMGNSLIDETYTEYNTETNELVDDLFINKPYLNKLLHPKILVSTIDQLLLSTEAPNKGKFLGPNIRNCTSDLIIDEVDNLNVKDFYAVGRLIEKYAMFNRKVIICSASLPYPIRELLYSYYQAGHQVYKDFTGKKENFFVGWIDENEHICENPINLVEFNRYNNSFCDNRVDFLRGKGIVGEILLTNGRVSNNEIDTNICNEIFNECEKLHEKNHMIVNGKKVSVGCVKLSRTQHCFLLFEQLAGYLQKSTDYEYRIIMHHAKDILITRDHKEKTIAELTNRKDMNLENIGRVKEIVENSNKKNIIILVIASSIISVGKDYDFDWGILTPQSGNEIIQFCGRIGRHRITGTEHRVSIIQFPLYSGLSRPGIETSDKMDTHDFEKLILPQELVGINSSYLISDRLQDANLKGNIFSYEQKIIHDTHFTKTSLINKELWFNSFLYLSSWFPKKTRFRESTHDVNLYYMDENGDFFNKILQNGNKITTSRKFESLIQNNKDLFYEFLTWDDLKNGYEIGTTRDPKNFCTIQIEPDRDFFYDHNTGIFYTK